MLFSDVFKECTPNLMNGVLKAGYRLQVEHVRIQLVRIASAVHLALCQMKRAWLEEAHQEAHPGVINDAQFSTTI